VREQQVVDGDGLQLAVLLTAVADVMAAVHHRDLVPGQGSQLSGPPVTTASNPVKLKPGQARNTPGPCRSMGCGPLFFFIRGTLAFTGGLRSLRLSGLL
jgi:hypothetical protein